MTIDQLGTTVNDLGIRVNDLGVTVNGLAKTIDDLAISMATAFNELKEEIVGVETRLSARIDQIHLDHISLSFDGKKVRGRVEKLENRVFGSVQEA